MNIGQITFGQANTAADAAAWRDRAYRQSQTVVVDTSIMPCNCRGPQPGEKQCPCALLAEMRKAAAMLENGVTIAGRKYRLVPDDGAAP